MPRIAGLTARLSIGVLLAGVGALVSHAQQFDRGQEPPPLSPAQSTQAFTVPDDLEMSLVLSEPEIVQPLQLSFDERGRMWVVEYRQYPAPAGLTQISHDEFWRSVYDKIPPPPPRHVTGKDRISIHEDTDGDGRFDAHKVFVDGLNIATSAAPGRGGVWVLNPPYLLFYPDRNRDDVPDGDPEVHLSGFGLEDTHSVANSLRWGPDGWLYACQGSTVSGHVRVEPLPTDKVPVSRSIITTLGQNVWRYQPDTRRYEVFAEGGGNAFGLEIDTAGRMFSGHNGGDTRGFHYVQGGYLQKGFDKHGELSNPYAFGYFPQMASNRVERFTHTFLIYEAAALPAAYHGALLGLEPMQGRVVRSVMRPAGSTFATSDLGHLVTTTDPWFRPVDIKLGPDGAIYIADWHDFSINHWKNYNGNMDASGGRIWRVRAKSATPPARLNLAAQSDRDLVPLLSHANRWWRETASRLLIDRAPASLLPELARVTASSTGAQAVGALWTAQAIRGRMNAATADDADVIAALSHRDPQVRLWAVRFIGDPFPGALDTGGTAGAAVSSSSGLERSVAARLAALAATEPNLEVRVQLAATAKRLPEAAAMPIVRALALRNEDASDPRQPLMIWWALEAKAAAHRNAVLTLFRDPAFWDRPLVKQHLIERIMRRYAQAGSHEDLLACAALLDLSPSKADSAILMRGFETAFKGQSVAGLPDELITAMARHGVGSVVVGLRRGDATAMAEALRVVANRAAPIDQRRQYIDVLGEVRSEASLPALLTLAADETDSTVLRAVLVALQPFDRAPIAQTVIGRLARLPAGARPAALTLLTGRASFAMVLLNAVENGELSADVVPLEFARRLKSAVPPAQVAAIDRHWPTAGRPSSAEMDREIARITRALSEGQGDPYAGKRLFTAACAACHRLFNQGGDIGPDLTSANRRDDASLLRAIVNPGAEIREGYEFINIATRDQRSVTGFLVERDDRRVILRGIDGQNVVLQRGEVASTSPAGMSLMPEGLTGGLDSQQLRDLLAYLRSSQPLTN